MAAADGETNVKQSARAGRCPVRLGMLRHRSARRIADWIPLATSNRRVMLRDLVHRPIDVRQNLSPLARFRKYMQERPAHTVWAEAPWRAYGRQGMNRYYVSTFTGSERLWTEWTTRRVQINL